MARSVTVASESVSAKKVGSSGLSAERAESTADISRSVFVAFLVRASRSQQRFGATALVVVASSALVRALF